VLLKNEGALLPLRPDQKKVALIGPLGKDKASLLGCWKCSGSADRVESLYEGLSAVMTSEPEFVEGCHVLNKESASFKQAIAIAKKAEVIILAIGETDAMSGEAHSRAHLGLPGRQQELVEAIHALGKPVIAVLMSGRPLVTPWIAEHIPAIIQAWHGGDRAGRAIAEILCGRANPSGKLVLSIPRSEGQIPVYYAHKNTGRPATGKGTTQFEEPFRSNYLDIPNSPQFPFGHGLSYTTFAYNDLEIKTPSLTAVENLIVTVHLSNTGARPGIETAQLYVQDLVGNITRPVKELKAFQRVALSPGEQKTIRFEVPASTLGFHDIQMRYQTEPGDFKVWVGPNSAEGLEEKFTIMAKRAAFQI
jgi:beta-glucosidase